MRSGIVGHRWPRLEEKMRMALFVVVVVVVAVVDWKMKVLYRHEKLLKIKFFRRNWNWKVVLFHFKHSTEVI